MVVRKDTKIFSQKIKNPPYIQFKALTSKPKNREKREQEFSSLHHIDKLISLFNKDSILGLEDT